jgi:hypothetical protein
MVAVLKAAALQPIAAKMQAGCYVVRIVNGFVVHGAVFSAAGFVEVSKSHFYAKG